MTRDHLPGPESRDSEARLGAAAEALSTGHGIDYHDGRVMSGPVDIYYIWYGDWSGSSGTAILSDFALNLSYSPYFVINRLYDDASGGRVSSDVRLAGSTADVYSHGTDLDGQGVWDIVQQALDRNDLPVDENGVYFVLTSPDVREAPGFCSDYCGWHSYGTYGNATIKYSFVGDASAQCPGACEKQTGSSPNGDPGADGMASVIAHELEETVTDPVGTGWYDSQGNENADKCAWKFGAMYTTSNTSQANMRLGNRDYLIQENWVNADAGYCAKRLSPDTPGLAWLPGDVDGDGKTDVIQTWANGGSLAIATYRSDGTRLVASSNDTMSAGTGALAWLTGDADGDGKTDILQPWNNGGALGLNVLRSTGTGYATWWGSSNMGAGNGALAWLTGDVDGDGKTDILQPWNNGGTLGLIVHRATGTGYVKSWETGNMGSGSGALAWLTGDVDGDGKTDIFQPWNSSGKLGLIVYRSTGAGYAKLWESGNMGSGYGAIAWLTGDADGDGKTDIFQLWNNSGKLGLIVYRSTGAGYAKLWENGNMGVGSSALAWLTGDVDGDGKTDILQPWNNGGKLGLNVLRSTGTSYVTSFSNSNMGQGYSALAWMTGDVFGTGKPTLIQPWNHGGAPSVLLYQPSGGGYAYVGGADL